MRRFNPEKELKKIQHGSRNKIIFAVIALLLIISIGSTYALYQVRYSKRIIYTKVAPFSNHDIDLAVYIDGSPSSTGDFPEKDAGKIYDKIDCGKTNVKAYWDYDKWALVLETSKKAKCTVYFKTGTDSEGNKLDTSGANPPELYQGLIPVKYGNNGEIIVADPKSDDWYNYEEKRWANAVLIDNTKVATDLSGNGNHGEIVGGAQITDAGLVLDGNDDGIYLGDMLKDLFKHSNTIQVKFKKSYTNNRDTLISNYISAAIPYVHYEIDATNQHRIYWSEKPYFGGNYTSDAFVTITYVYNSEEHSIKIYTDDELVYTATDKSIFTTDMDFSNAYIGRNQTQIGGISSVLDGVIEKVMIYDNILSENEIKRNITAIPGKIGDNGVVESNLRLYYDFKVSQTVDTTPGKILDMTAISQMYVWIPRYKYQLFNVNDGFISEQMINIKFEHETETTGEVKCTIAINGEETCENVMYGNWFTHPAFKFGNKDLTGLWVGKFESGGTIEDILIKPNISSLATVNLSSLFYASRNIEKLNSNKYNLSNEQIDTHIMKNMDWGAIAYLSNSRYGICVNNSCNEIALNLNPQFLTGYANTSYTWDTEEGMKASTTGNITGIYDMSGGAWEWTMGTLVDAEGHPTINNSGFNASDLNENKYYDRYNSNQLYHYGDGTKEVLINKNLSQIIGVNYKTGWYDDFFSTYQGATATWSARGSGYLNTIWRGNVGGIYALWLDSGQPYPTSASRVVLTAQDGNE